MCQEFSLSLGQSSGASVLPWVAGAVTGNMAGWAADTLVNKVSGGRDRSGSSAGGAVRHIDVMRRRNSAPGARRWCDLGTLSSAAVRVSAA